MLGEFRRVEMTWCSPVFLEAVSSKMLQSELGYASFSLVTRLTRVKTECRNMSQLKFQLGCGEGCDKEDLERWFKLDHRGW